MAVARGQGLALRSGLVWLAVAAAACAQIGCAWLGPRSIRSARGAYNDAIVATNSEQLLGTIVRMRYGEPSSLLAVSSITASMHVSAMGGAEFGFGRATNYAGNLVPLSAGGSYEENPTISYTPIQGEKYLRQLLSPVPLDVTLLLLDSLGASPELMGLLLRSINGMPSASHAPGESAADTSFARVAELLAEMTRSGRAEWVQRPAGTPALALVLPAEHLASGIAPTLPEPLNGAAGIHIHSSEATPDHAMTAIEHHDFWYWIDASDSASKVIFRILSSLMSVRMGDDDDRARPVLTVPVSR